MVNGYAGVRNRYHPYLKDSVKMHPFGFNLGVEIGQLAIVAVFFPLAYGLRPLLFYKRFVLQFGSAAIMIVASTWMAERVFDFKWLPF